MCVSLYTLSLRLCENRAYRCPGLLQTNAVGRKRPTCLTGDDIPTNSIWTNRRRVRALISLKCRKTLEQTIPGLVRFETFKLFLSCDVLPLIPTLFTPKVVLTSLHHQFALKRSRDSLSLSLYGTMILRPNLTFSGVLVVELCQCVSWDMLWCVFIIFMGLCVMLLL